MAPEATLQLEYLQPADLHHRPEAWWRDVFAAIHFAPAHSDANAAELAEQLSDHGVEALTVRAPLLGPRPDTVEIWRLPGPKSSGRLGRVHFRRHERLLFVSASLEEAPLDAGDVHEAAARLRAVTSTLYCELFAALGQLGYPHPLRLWNFVPQINGAVGEGERYWLFNEARQDAFLDHRRTISGQVPAATAVGTGARTPLMLCGIASAAAPITLENPRQRSPWEYPPQYGPRSPTFARACLDTQHHAALYISGTASILGHETVHGGDARAQTQETLRNIRALIDVANTQLDRPRHALERLHYRAYVRRAADQPQVEAVLRAEAGAAPALYVQADLCRRDLLVEIEAFGQ